MTGEVAPAGAAVVPLWTDALWAGIISTLATGLGAIPLLFVRRTAVSAIAVLYAVAAGFMVSASVFSIAVEGLHRGGPVSVGLGFIAGGLFLWTATLLFPHNSATHTPVKGMRAKLVLLALFIHSIPEGIAIGVGFATGETAFGLVLAIAIAIHNIPEGMAMSLPLRQDGASFWRCFWTSVLTSLPQALLAVPAFFFVTAFGALLPVGLAFAGGAMLFLVVFDLLPEAFESAKSRSAVAWGFLLGLTGMMVLTVVIERIASAY